MLQVLWEKRGFLFLRGGFHSPDIREHQVLDVRDPRNLVGNPGFVAGLQEVENFETRIVEDFEIRIPPTDGPLLFYRVQRFFFDHLSSSLLG